VLARIGGGDGDLGMGLDLCKDANQVDVLPGQDLLIVKAVRLGAELGRCALSFSRDEVAGNDKLTVVKRRQGRQVVIGSDAPTTYDCISDEIHAQALSFSEIHLNADPLDSTT
jgi:hypothetical protein